MREILLSSLRTVSQGTKSAQVLISRYYSPDHAPDSLEILIGPGTRLDSRGLSRGAKHYQQRLARRARQPVPLVDALGRLFRAAFQPPDADHAGERRATRGA